MSTAQLKQRTAAVISLVALLSALLLGLARYESSVNPSFVHPTHVATYHIVYTGGDIISRRP